MPKFDPNVEKKNPIAYFIASFFFGMVIAFIGWQMNDSTNLNTAKFGMPLIVLGVVMIIVGLIGMFTYKKKPKQ
jgi:uncharacterized membrane protein